MNLNSQPQYPRHLQHKADTFKFEEERAYCFAHVKALTYLPQTWSTHPS